LNRLDDSDPNYRIPEAPAGFPEPWAAKVFAMTVHLCETGVISWNDWTEGLSAKLHEPSRRPDGTDYYDCWTEALCDFLVERRIVEGSDILLLQERWQKAAEKTPHGEPILLENAGRI
jgi:nitrile hydratase accessory protein